MSEFLKSLLVIIVLAGVGLYLIAEIPHLVGDNGSLNILSFLSGKTSNNTSSNTEIKSYIADDQIPAGFTRKQLSPNFGKGKINVDLNDGEIDLSFNFVNKTDVTGWKIRTNGGETIIPILITGYDVESGVNLNRLSIKDGNVKIFASASPTGRNFRLNKCIGYLNYSYNFSPRLPEGDCPQLDRASYASLVGACQEYILSLDKCQPAEKAAMNSLQGGVQANDCKNFLSKIGYSSCANTYKSDADFYENEWWIWNNKNILDKSHDWVKLFDAKGLLVDSYIY